MASYIYRTILTLPVNQNSPMGFPVVKTIPEVDAAHAVYCARTYTRPAGSRIRIERIRADRKDKSACYWMRYRSYEVSATGKVIRTDR